MKFCEFCAPFYTGKKPTSGIKGVMAPSCDCRLLYEYGPRRNSKD